MAVTAGSRTIRKPNWNGSVSTAFGVEALEVPAMICGIPHIPTVEASKMAWMSLRSTKRNTVYGNDPAKAMEHLRHYMISATGRIRCETATETHSLLNPEKGATANFTVLKFNRVPIVFPQLMAWMRLPASCFYPYELIIWRAQHQVQYFVLGWSSLIKTWHGVVQCLLGAG